MDPIGKITLEENRHDDDRIGSYRRSEQAEKAVAIEKVVNRFCPLTASFDIRPIQDYYFSEFTYFDFFGGISIQTFNQEINVRLIKKILEDDSYPIHDHVQEIKSRMSDKYQLSADDMMPDQKRIVLCPGSNMINALSKERLSVLMNQNDDVYLKPHPLTNNNTLRELGITYGYHRIINKDNSIVPYIQHGQEFWYTQNSELGFLLVANDAKVHNITNVNAAAALTYYPYYFFFTENLDHNKQVINKLFSCPWSGIVMPWHHDVEARVCQYYDNAMEYRAFFKPLTIPYDKELFRPSKK